MLSLPLLSASLTLLRLIGVFHCATSYPRSPLDHDTCIASPRFYPWILCRRRSKGGRVAPYLRAGLCQPRAPEVWYAPCSRTLEASTPGTPTFWPGSFTCSRAAACLKAPHKVSLPSHVASAGRKRRVPVLRVEETALSRLLHACANLRLKKANICLPRSSPNPAFNATNCIAGHLADQRRTNLL